MKTIKKKTITDLKEWFTHYVQTFKYGNRELKQNTILKEEHTLLVCHEMQTLAEQLGLTTNERRLAEIIALFHDIGRFEQFARYYTFVDKQSENHAELGVKILRNYGVLDQFEDSTSNLILRTIRYHNRAVLPPDETETCLFYSKLLRDADKLDIWRVVTDYYHRQDGKRNGAIELDLPDTPGISEAVYRDLLNKKIVNIHHMKNLNDFKLLQVGWVFDLNFAATFRAVRSRLYLEKIREVLPESEKINSIFAVIHSHLDENIQNK
ncbi:HD domain-containing protein [candidate division KSB1 bacterium]|nr:HD domain-containing protein [candidate division KSB1 bacterium]